MTNQKKLVKKGDVRDTETGSSNTIKRTLFKITKENSTNKSLKNAQEQTKNQFRKKNKKLFRRQIYKKKKKPNRRPDE